MRAGLWIGFLFFLGCSSLEILKSTYKIDHLDVALLDLQKAVASVLPGGLRTTSSNGREFYSRHFIVDGAKYKPAGDAKERFIAQMTVLGDGRPYTIEILVRHERRILRGGRHTYEVVGYDYRQAEGLALKVRARLSQRREDTNIIDDFRVF